MRVLTKSLFLPRVEYRYPGYPNIVRVSRHELQTGSQCGGRKQAIQNRNGSTGFFRGCRNLAPSGGDFPINLQNPSCKSLAELTLDPFKKLTLFSAHLQPANSLV